MDLLCDFFDSTVVTHGAPRIREVCHNEPYGIIERASVELSEEQLEKVWLLIDGVVLNYRESRVRQMYRGLFTPVIAIIDDEVYWSRFASGDIISYFNYRIPRGRQAREASVIADGLEMNLLMLTHHLIDLSPFPTGWE